MGRIAWFALAVTVGCVACRPTPPDAALAPSTSTDAKVLRDTTRTEEPTEGVHQGVRIDAVDDRAPSEVVEPDTEESLPSPPQKVEMTTGNGRGVAWRVPRHWPKIGDEDEFRVATWRLPAVSMAGAGECALFRFPGGGNAEDNLHRWMGQFVGADGKAESVEAAQAKRTIHGVPATLVRAEGTYTAEIPGMKDTKEKHENYTLFGAVIMGEGDPVFAKCTAPIGVMNQEANHVLAWIDSFVIGKD